MSGDTQFHTQLHSIPCHIFLPIVGHHLHHLPGLSHCQKRYINSLLTLTEDTIFRDLPGLSPYHSNSAWELYWSSNSTQHCETFLDCLNITATLRESYISHQTSPRILAPSWTVSVSQQMHSLHFLWSWYIYFILFHSNGLITFTSFHLIWSHLYYLIWFHFLFSYLLFPLTPFWVLKPSSLSRGPYPFLLGPPARWVLLPNHCQYINLGPPARID